MSTDQDRQTRPQADESPRIPGSQLPSVRQRATALAPPAAVPMLLVGVFVVFGILSPDLFLTWTNVRITLASQATVLLLAVAMTVPLRAGTLDLSVPATMIVSASAAGALYGNGVSAITAVVLVLLLGMGIGLANGLLIAGLGLDGLIVTLAMFTLVAGASSNISGGSLILTVPESLKTFAHAELLTLPMIVWVGWAVAAILLFVFEFTPLGRYWLFIGGNSDAARLAGIRVQPLRVASFVTAAVIASLAGLLHAGFLGSVDSASSFGYLMAPATAAFLGTTTIQMGRFNILGTVIGLYLLAFGMTGLQLLGVEGWISDVFNGVALIIALAFSRYFEVRKSRQVGRSFRTTLDS